MLVGICMNYECSDLQKKLKYWTYQARFLPRCSICNIVFAIFVVVFFASSLCILLVMEKREKQLC